jgi:hypothetical protein
MSKLLFLFFSSLVLSFAAKAQSPASYAAEFTKKSGNNVVLRSPNGIYTLVYQRDGNLVLLNGKTSIWATKTNGKASTKLIFQGDGNLVLYNNTTPIWGAQCHGKGGSYVSLQDDGNLCIYNKNNMSIWATMTQGK